MTRIGEQSGVFFLRDDQGSVWSGGYPDIEAAQAALELAEACDWDADQMPEAPIAIDEHGRRRKA